MTMTANEQNLLNQAMQTAGLTQVVIIKQQDAVNVYQICSLTPMRTIAAADIGAFAANYGCTVASP